MDLGYNPDIFGIETCDWSSVPLITPDFRPRKKVKMSTLSGIEPDTSACKAMTLPLRDCGKYFQFVTFKFVYS